MNTSNLGMTEKNTVPDGPFINLDHLTTIEPAYLDSIINDSWGMLSLNSLGEITPEIAKILGGHKGVLSLNGVTSLDDESAKHLAQHKGTLFLQGIKTIDSSIAELFSKSNETIILGLESVNDKVAHALGHSHGVIGLSTRVTEQVRELVEGV